MKYANRKRNIILAVTASFVALMLLASVALFYADEADVRVESRSLQKTSSYSLDDIDLIEPADDPLGATDADAIDMLITEDIVVDDVTLDAMNLNRDFQGEQVPEPASITLLSLGGLALLRRRRNRK